MSNNRGFATRSLIALLITLSILPLAVSIMAYCASLKQNYNLVNSEIALMDLRRIMLISYDLCVNDNQLDFIYHNEEYHLVYVNDKLILTPGTQIILNNIKEASFYEKNDSIYLRYIDDDNKEYKRNIGSAKRFYIDDFSFDNDELSSDNNSDE